MKSYINSSFILSVLCQSDEVHKQNITRARPEVFTLRFGSSPVLGTAERTKLTTNDTQFSYAVVLVKWLNFVPL